MTSSAKHIENNLDTVSPIRLLRLYRLLRKNWPREKESVPLLSIEQFRQLLLILDEDLFLSQHLDIKASLKREIITLPALEAILAEMLGQIEERIDGQRITPDRALGMLEGVSLVFVRSGICTPEEALMLSSWVNDKYKKTGKKMQLLF